MAYEPWDGGYIRKDAHGRPVYIIRRMIGGRRFDVSTRATDVESARAQLRRFEADPDNYNPAPVSEPLFLDAGLVKGFLEWSRDEKKNTREWVKVQQRRLVFWTRTFHRRDLRKLDLREDILPALEGLPGRAHSIRVLKAFFGWLRNEKHLLTLAQDPVAGVLKAPQSRPSQWTTPKTIPLEHFEAVRMAIVPDYRDALDVLAGTGWHTTELERFAAGGSVDTVPEHREGEAAAILLCPVTKGGAPLRTAVSEAVAAAARRLRERGKISRHYLRSAILDAVELVNEKRRKKRQKPIEAFSGGRFRHSVATWAIERGADPASVAAFLGHKSPRTTQRFYATLATPKKVPTLR